LFFFFHVVPPSFDGHRGPEKIWNVKELFLLFFFQQKKIPAIFQV